MFNGIWLEAVEPLTIQGRDIEAGEQFHLSRVHAGALLVTRKARVVHPQPPPKTRTVATPEPPQPAPRRRGRPRKVTTPETPPAAPEAAVPDFPVDGNDEAIEIPSRRYQRRDLEADE